MDYRELIQKGIDYIEDNLKTDIHAGELADRAGFSISRYYRLFQGATGMPVMQYILRRRLLHAIYEIRSGSTGIEAALQYGFDTYAGFYRAFQREFGCTPSTFLKFCRAKQPYRLNLLKEEHAMITKKKAAEIIKHWNLENERIEDIYYEGTGNKNENAFYVGEEAVLKFTANPGKMKNHIELSRSIERVGLCAAVPIKTAEEREYVQEGEIYFYLTKRLPGKQVAAGQLYEGDFAGKARFVGEIIGQLDLALENVELPVNEANIYETVKGWALPKAREILNLPETFCRDYLETFGRLYEKLPKQIIHRDPNPGNIIQAEDKWGFIDFDLSEKNVRIFDPCYAATAVLSETFAEGDTVKLERWLEIYRNIILGYDSVVKLTAEEWEAVPYVLSANQMICVAWFAEQEKYEELFEVNKKMTKWLLGKIF